MAIQLSSMIVVLTSATRVKICAPLIHKPSSKRLPAKNWKGYKARWLRQVGFHLGGGFSKSAVLLPALLFWSAWCMFRFPLLDLGLVGLACRNNLSNSVARNYSGLAVLLFFAGSCLGRSRGGTLFFWTMLRASLQLWQSLICASNVIFRPRDRRKGQEQ